MLTAPTTTDIGALVDATLVLQLDLAPGRAGPLVQAGERVEDGDDAEPKRKSTRAGDSQGTS